MARVRRRTAGFSLLESLIALTLFLVIILAGIEIFASARKTLQKLEEAQTSEESIAAALERIRADVRSAGRGLAGPDGIETVAGLEAAGDTLVIRSAEITTPLTADAAAGQTVLAVADGREFAAGRTAAVCDGTKSETVVIAAAEENGLSLVSPLAGSYARSAAEVILVQKISLYMDAGRAVLRRKVDAGTGQPLLEEALSFAFSIGTPSPIVTIAIRSRIGNGETHGTTVHAGNAALALRR
jgi:type II secretory pathway pseudopilin PulG